MQRQLVSRDQIRRVALKSDEQILDASSARLASRINALGLQRAMANGAGAIRRVKGLPIPAVTRECVVGPRRSTLTPSVNTKLRERTRMA